MMCSGVGIDLCEISRMEKLLEDSRFLVRFFSEEEIRYIHSRGRHAAATMAGLFAAREALGKALGSGLDFDLREAVVAHDEHGKPFYRFSGRLAARLAKDRFLLSISHDGGVAAAVCIRESPEDH